MSATIYRYVGTKTPQTGEIEQRKYVLFLNERTKDMLGKLITLEKRIDTNLEIIDSLITAVKKLTDHVELLTHKAELPVERKTDTTGAECDCVRLR